MKKLLIGLLVVLILVAAVGWFLPTSYAIERAITIEATPAAVHAYVGELTKWPEWSPWLEADPTIVTTYGDTTTGVGAHQSWTAKHDAGELTFTKCDEATGIAYDLTFIMGETRAPATSAMAYAAGDGATTVTWTMQGDVGEMLPPIAAGYMNLFIQREIAGMFEQGLATLKSKVEAGD